MPHSVDPRSKRSLSNSKVLVVAILSANVLGAAVIAQAWVLNSALDSLDLAHLEAQEAKEQLSSAQESQRQLVRQVDSLRDQRDQLEDLNLECGCL